MSPAEHPEPCPTPASPFKVGAEVVVIAGRFAGLRGRVLTLAECGIDGGRHVPICEAQVSLDRLGRPLWFRYDTELAAPEGAEGDDEGYRERRAGERAPGAPEPLPGLGGDLEDHRA